MSSFTDPGDTAMAEEDAQVVGSDAVDMDLAALQAQQFQTSPFLEPPCPGEHPPVTPHTPAVLPGITKGPTTMENRSQSDEQMALALSAISSPTSSPFSRCKIIAIEYPPELVFGLNETARFCVHQNLVTNETMDDSDSGPWDENLVLHVRFLNVSSDSNSALPERALSVNSKLDPSWESDGRFKYDVEIRYRRRTEAFRALGRLLGSVFEMSRKQNYRADLNWEERAQFETLGAMIDCSRSAVLTVDSTQYLLRLCALMGMNTFQLYTEDTYQVKGEPFFGYMRGGFSEAELKIIDNYAFEWGIEVFPCIQTLGHFGQILQWPRFSNIRDTNEVVLANSDESYAFIERMITAVTSCLRSKRIHIGMDEAHGIGDGRYKQLFGSKDGTKIFLEHIHRVNEICTRKGLQPLIWSDMLFTLAAQNNSLSGYYDTGVPLNLPVNLPPNITLVFWDYYHTVADTYSKKIQEHRDLGCEPWVAGGIWTWNRLVTALPFSFEASRACLNACKQSNVKHVFVTLWGDDGNEYDTYSALAGLQYYSEHAYTSEKEIDWDLFKRNFAGVCGGKLEDWIMASRLDMVPDATSVGERFPSNISKWILWQDPIYSFLSPQYQGLNLVPHFEFIREHLDTVSTQFLDLYPLNSRLQFPALLAKVIRDKAHLKKYLQKAYYSPHPKESLANLNQTLVIPLLASVNSLWKHHRDKIWLSTFKPFGLEILELRYGAIRTRLETLKDRLEAFCISDCHTDSIPELELDIHNEVYPGLGLDLVFDFARAYTPSRALGTG